MNKIAIFASGSGTNAQRIMEHFSGNFNTSVRFLLTNRPDAGAIERAKKFNVPVKVFDKNMFYKSNHIVDLLADEGINWVVLAGFLWLIPANMIERFPNRIVNIHPALLPKYGGKGMYGMNVHEAVIKAGEKESGITIHYVNEKYDSGDIIFQAKTCICPSDTPEILAEKIHELEHKHFPVEIEKLMKF